LDNNHPDYSIPGALLIVMIVIIAGGIGVNFPCETPAGRPDRQKYL
jgi:hypothetical protein